MLVLALVGCGGGPEVAGCVSPGTWWVDADGDGYAGTEMHGCEIPAGAAVHGPDCDDGDPRINPSACDVPGDDVDGDCEDGDARGVAPGGVFAFVGSLTIDSDAAAEGFCDTWNAVNGDLIVTGAATDLSALWCVCEVAGDVSITDVPALTTLAGLEDLRFVGGSFRVERAGLEALAFGRGLASVGGDLAVNENPALETMEPTAAVVGGAVEIRADPLLSDLQLHASEVGGDLSLSALPSLSSLETSFKALERIGGSFTVADLGTLALVDVPAAEIGGDVVLASLPALEEVEIGAATIGGAWTLEANPLLRIVRAPDVASVGGDLRVESNPSLVVLGEDVPGPPLVVGGAFKIQYNQVEGYDGAGAELGLPARLTTVSLEFALRDDYLAPYASFDDLAWAGQSVTVSGVGAATDTLTFPALTDVYGSLVGEGPAPILDVPNLVFLGNGVAIRGGAGGVVAPLLEEALSVSVSDNPDQLVVELPALRNVVYAISYVRTPPTFDDLGMPLVEHASQLSLWDVDGIQTVGLPLLADVDTSVFITDCDGLVDLAGLPSLTALPGELTLGDNHLLANVAGPTLTSLGYLVLTDNPALTDVTALESVDEVGAAVVITGNTRLTNAAALALVAAIGEENIGGRVTVSGNGP